MKPFALLMAALKATDRVAIAKVTMRQKEQLCTLRLYERTIALETMFYSDEIRSTEELAVPGENVKVTERELKMATSLVDMLSGDFDFEEYRDNYRDALLEIIERKSEGETIEAPKAAAPKPVDLMEALRQSVEDAQKRKAPKGEVVEHEEVSRRRARRAG
jgi:DNA end-binding protein Ku